MDIKGKSNVSSEVYMCEMALISAFLSQIELILQYANLEFAIKE